MRARQPQLRHARAGLPLPQHAGNIQVSCHRHKVNKYEMIAPPITRCEKRRCNIGEILTEEGLCSVLRCQVKPSVKHSLSRLSPSNYNQVPLNISLILIDFTLSQPISRAGSSRAPRGRAWTWTSAPTSTARAAPGRGARTRSGPSAASESASSDSGWIQ